MFYVCTMLFTCSCSQASVYFRGKTPSFVYFFHHVHFAGINNYFPTYFVRAAGHHGHNQVTPTDKFVGFSAGLSKMVKTNDTDLIVYDRVFLNMGNGYDSTTGVFTCPNAGTYAFLVHGVSTATSQLNLDIYRNNNYTVSVFAHIHNGYASGHQSIVLQLDERK